MFFYSIDFGFDEIKKMTDNNIEKNDIDSDPNYESRVKEIQRLIHDPNYEARIKELQTILDISNLVGSVMEIDDILSEIAATAAKQMGVEVCSIYLLCEDKSELIMRATYGLNPDLVGKTAIKTGIGIQGIVAQTGEPIEIADTHSDPRHVPLNDQKEDLCHAMLCIPLRIQEEKIGVITARKHEVYQFSLAERTLFEMIAKQVAIVIEKSRLYFSKIQVERVAAIGVSLSEIAHYIKNLLQAMKGGAYFLESGLNRGDLEKARDGWKILRKSQKKIAYLVENMLNFSRSLKPDLISMNINDTVIELLHSIEDNAQERGIEIKAYLYGSMPDIMADANRVYDVLLNIVSNAFDAIPDDSGGIISISTGFDEKELKASVIIEDNGDGIPKDVLPKIFNLFFSTKGSKGTGIGLAVCKKIIEEHGGHIKAESETNKGTKFIVELPSKPPIIP